MNLSKSELEFLGGLKEGNAFELLSPKLFFPENSDPLLLPNSVWITPTEKKFQIRVRFAADAGVPNEFESLLKDSSREITASHLWRIGGETIEGEKIQIIEVIPPTEWNNNGVNVTYTLEGGRIASAPDEETEEEKKKRLEAIEVLIEKIGFQHPAKPSKKTKQKSSREFPFSYLAILPGVESIPRNTSTSTERNHAFHGKVSQNKCDSFVFEGEQYECCFESREDDLWIHVRFKIETVDDEADALRIGDSVLNTIAHLHGCHPWPFLKVLKKGGETRLMEYRPYERLYSKSAVPLSQSRMFQDEENIVQFCLKAAKFFASESESRSYVNRVLWLLRQADKPGTAYEIRILAQCSILEGLIDSKWEKIGDRCESAAFRRTKALALSSLKKLQNRSRNQKVKDMLERLHGYVRDWNYWRMAERWRMVVESMGMSWESFKPVYQDWNHYRHPLAHGFKKSRKRTGISTELIAYSRFCGAINLIVASEFQFLGRIDSSHLEGHDSFDMSGGG